MNEGEMNEKFFGKRKGTVRTTKIATTTATATVAIAPMIPYGTLPHCAK